MSVKLLNEPDIPGYREYQLDQLMRVAALSIIVSMLLAVVLHYTLVSWIGDGADSWLAVIVFAGLIRVMIVPLAKSRWLFDARTWFWVYVATSIFNAAIWSYASWFLFVEGNLEPQVLLAFGIAGLVAGGSTTLGYSLFLVLSFQLLILIPLLLRFVLESHEYAGEMSVMVSFYLVSLAAGSVRTSRHNMNHFLSTQKVHEQQQQLLRHTQLQDASEAVAQVAGWYMDYIGKIPLHTPQLVKMHAQDPGEITDVASILCLYSQHSREQFWQACEHTRATGEGWEILMERAEDGVSGDQWVLCKGEVVSSATEGDASLLVVMQDVSQAIRLQRAKDEFLSVVSHELRTPLTSIKGAVGMLRAVKDEDRLVMMQAMAMRNIEYLELLIEDILDVSRLDNGHLDLIFSTESVTDLVSEAISMTRPYMERFNTRAVLHNSCDPAGCDISVDSRRFLQVMTNLLSNAAKFSYTGTDITVSVRSASGRIRIEVCNQGEGIPEEMLQAVFDKFVQVDSTATRKAGGTGLGLYICQSLVEAMNGSIGVSSIPGRQTTFWLEFDCQTKKAG